MRRKRKKRRVAHTFSNDPDMIKQLKQISHEKNISVSKIIRETSEKHLSFILLGNDGTAFEGENCRILSDFANRKLTGIN